MIDQKMTMRSFEFMTLFFGNGIIYLRTCSKSFQKSIKFIFNNPLEITLTHSYPSNINPEQFDKIKPILESARKKTRPRSIDLYDVFCGVLYVLKSGCQWRMLPKEFPKWRTCHYYFSIWLSLLLLF